VKQKSINPENKKTKLKLRLVEKKDTKFIFRLYNNNVLEKKFFSSKKVNFKNHEKWLKNKIKEKMFFICLRQKEIGYVKFEKIDKKNLSVSIAVKKIYKKKGYGKYMLIKALNKKKISKYNVWAKVKSKNYVSKNFFLNLGFKLIKNDEYMVKANSNEKIYK
tara:strand:- start:128 stop:613 length:486 start_codon:yes stop_codon:yes gene_type:complete